MSVLITSCLVFRAAVKFVMLSSKVLPEMNNSEEKLPSGRVVMFVTTSMPSCPRSFLSVEPEATKLDPLPGASDNVSILPLKAASRP